MTPTSINVKLLDPERDGNCRFYYRNMDTKRLYCRYDGESTWYTVNETQGYREPDCPLKGGITMVIHDAKGKEIDRLVTAAYV